MALVFEKSVGKPVSIYGKDYSLAAVTVKEADEFQAKIDSAESPKAQTAVGMEFISKRGVPIEVLECMEIDHFLKLIEYILPKKG